MGYHSLLWELNSQSQFYWEGDPLSSAWQSLQQKNGAYLPVHPGDMTTHVHSAKGFSQLHLGTQHTGPLQNQEKKKKNRDWGPSQFTGAGSGYYWQKSQFCFLGDCCCCCFGGVPPLRFLFVFITNAVSDILTFTSQAGAAEGQCRLGISLGLYLKVNPISAKGLSKITQCTSFKAWMLYSLCAYLGGNILGHKHLGSQLYSYDARQGAGLAT